MKLPTHDAAPILHTYRRKPSLLIGFSANELVPDKVCLIAAGTACVNQDKARIVLTKGGEEFPPASTNPGSQQPDGTPARFARYLPAEGAEPLAPGLYDLWVCGNGRNCSRASDNDPESAGDSKDAEPDRSEDDPKTEGTGELDSDVATGEDQTSQSGAGHSGARPLQVCIHHFVYPVLPCPSAASSADETVTSQHGNAAPPSKIVVGPDGKLCFFVDDTIDKTHYEGKYEIQVGTIGTNRIPLEPKSARGESDKKRAFWLEAELTEQLLFGVDVYYKDTFVGHWTLHQHNNWTTELRPILVSFLKDIALGENGAGDHSGKLWKVRADYPNTDKVEVVWKIDDRTRLRSFWIPEDLEPVDKTAQMTIAQLWRIKGLCYWSRDDELDGHLVINNLGGISGDFDSTYDQLPAEWQLRSKLSEWLSTGSLKKGNKGSFLALHLHHPVVFPLWGGDHSFQSALLNILGVNALSTASDKVHYAVSLWQHLEFLIGSDPEVRYWFSKADTDLHFDYVTDFVVYTDNPYARGNELYARLRDQKQVILYGPPGTGKTYRAKTQTEWMIDWWLARDFGKSDLPPSTRFWKMIQFHPAYTYEDFIQGLRPTPQGGALAFEVKDGHFKAFCESAGIIERLILEIKLRLEAGEVSTLNDLIGSFNEQNSAKLLSNLGIGVSTSGEGEDWGLKVEFPERHGNNGGDSNRQQKSVSFQRDDFSDSSKLKKKLDEIHLPPFVFIIDEINRANLSAVLGELMYCLEYRGPEHARKLPLAHLQTEDPVFTRASQYFFVPRNVFVVGTMNTIDKSTERVDFALRRRFGWWKCDPEPWKADAVMGRKYKNREDWKVRPHLEKLNEELRDDLRRMGGDFQIGETYFFDLPKYGETKDTKEEALKQLWELQLRPVLEDFYGDARQWEKNEAALWNIVVTGKPDGNGSPPSGSGKKDWETISKVLKIKPQAILYGPPGTGKTWAVSEDLCRKQDIPEDRFELIQFHPAYTYEDFLQGLRPIPAHTGNPQGQTSTSSPAETGHSGNNSGIRYEVRPGLFKRICRDAGRFERGLFEILAPLKEGKWKLRKKDELSTDLCDSQDGTHNGDGWKDAYGLGWVWCGRMNFEQMSVFLHIDHGDGAIKLVFSCQTGLKFPSPIVVPRAADLSVTFDEVVDHVLNAVADKLPRWLLVIDEINRADLAAVFGELMYCLEYRGPQGAIELPTTVLANQSAPQGQGSNQGREGGAVNGDESTPFVMLNGREMFFVPSNLWIVGTMNTIDRSTEPVDFAMRRRFAWVRFEPRRTFLSILSGRYSGETPGILSGFFPELIMNEQNRRWSRKTIGIHIVRIARKVNKQLESDKFPSGYRIGETYYFRIAEIMKAVEETCQLRSTIPEDGIHARIHYGPFGGYRLEGGKDATPATVLFKHHIEPLLEDFHQQQSRSWESERNKYVQLFLKK